MGSSETPVPARARPRRVVKATCPECDVRFPAPAGRAVPCPSCGNPVVATASPDASPDPSSTQRRSDPPPDTPEAPDGSEAKIPWGLAACVLLVLGVAHYGLYLLVSADARSELAAIEARQGHDVHLDARAPGEPPTAGSPAYADWLQSKELYDDARAFREHETRRSWVARGLGLAYLVQLGITGWALFRVAGAQSRRTRTRGRKRNGSSS